MGARRVTGTFLSVGLCIVVAVLVIYPPAGPVEAQSPFGTSNKLGVADVGQIFKKYSRALELERRINEEKDHLGQQIVKQRDKLIKLRKESEFLTGDTLQNAEDDIRIEVERMRLMKQRADLALKRKFEEYTLKILSEIEEVVREYGHKHGFTLILHVDSKKWGQDRLQAVVRSVMFFSREVDITKTVLEILNDPSHLKKKEQQDQEPDAPDEGAKPGE